MAKTNASFHQPGKLGRMLIGVLLVAWNSHAMTADPLNHRSDTTDLELVGMFYGTQRSPAYDSRIFSAIHPIQTAGGYCSAFLIDKWYALTAAHCVEEKKPPFLFVDRNRSMADSIEIEKAYMSKNYRRIAAAVYQGDWAILKLRTPAPSDLAILKIARPGEFGPGTPAISVGYPKFSSNDGSIRMKGENCRVRELSGDSISSDCPSAKGSSGGPLLVLVGKEWKVAGINSAQWVDPYGNMVMNGQYTADTANHFSNFTMYADRVLASFGLGAAPAPAPAPAAPSAKADIGEPPPPPPIRHL